MSDTDPHQKLVRNGKEQQQDAKLRELEHEAEEAEERLNKNDADHARIMVLLEDIMTDIKARKLLRGVLMVLAGATLAGMGWFVITTMSHVWKGEQWGHELERGIQRNEDAIQSLRRDAAQNNIKHGHNKE